tara:strand:- start:70 stop:336 length:267 start_codon:yes stop_codon:yes gene_type:complete
MKTYRLLTAVLVAGGLAILPLTAMAGEHGGAEHGGAEHGSKEHGGESKVDQAVTLRKAAAKLNKSDPVLAKQLSEIASSLESHAGGHS